MFYLRNVRYSKNKHASEAPSSKASQIACFEKILLLIVHSQQLRLISEVENFSVLNKIVDIMQIVTCFRNAVCTSYMPTLNGSRIAFLPINIYPLVRPIHF